MTLEAALVRIETKQIDLALNRLRTAAAGGDKDVASALLLAAGQVQGLEMARQIIDAILNPKDEKPRK
jgi:hypothetical protein